MNALKIIYRLLFTKEIEKYRPQAAKALDYLEIIVELIFVYYTIILPYFYNINLLRYKIFNFGFAYHILMPLYTIVATTFPFQKSTNESYLDFISHKFNDAKSSKYSFILKSTYFVVLPISFTWIIWVMFKKFPINPSTFVLYYAFVLPTTRLLSIIADKNTTITRFAIYLALSVSVYFINTSFKMNSTLSAVIYLVPLIFSYIPYKNPTPQILNVDNQLHV